MSLKKRMRMFQFSLYKTSPYQQNETIITYKACTLYAIINSQLYKEAHLPNGLPCRIMVADEVLDVVTKAHCDKLHADTNSVWANSSNQSKGIRWEEV